MSKLGRIIKKVAESSITPDSFFDFYFNIKNRRNKQRLLQQLENGSEINHLMNEKNKAHWQPRIQNVMSSKDNLAIPRHSNAGQIIDESLIMHNGIKVEPLSYYNVGMLKMLKDNKGVHEPQEEKIFQEVLNTLDQKQNKTMLELGAYWSFYSMWFLEQFPNSNCFMVEPERMNLFYGKANFRLNNFKGTFIQAGIGKQVDKNNRILTVDEICQQNNIKFLDILHSDIQGFEADMLEGSHKMLLEKKVGYVFVSTHSNELHEACFQILKNKYHYKLVASANVDESFSWDGILVMKLPGYPGIDQVDISKRRTNGA